jgi:hypothetical protein
MSRAERLRRAKRIRRAYARHCMAALTRTDDEEWRPARERCQPRQWLALALLSWAMDYAEAGL